MSDILKLLTNELNMIQDGEVRSFTKAAVVLAPSEYWVKPSAHTMGHHPYSEHDEWGNFFHVRRVVRIASDLAEAANFSQLERDYLISAMIIHDIGKCGIDGRSDETDPNHPNLVRIMLQPLSAYSCFPTIMGIVETHMGRWGNLYPRSDLQLIGYYADYIASREYMEISV